MERLQKRLAQAGIASRRKAEEMIKEGRVSVNGEIITAMGFLVDARAKIEVDGILITKEDKKYYCLYKPRNIISSVNDEHQRKTVIDLLPASLKQERLFPVGRLDYDTKGIILITNDGAFSNLMVGPRSGVEKEYLARVEGIVNPQSLEKFAKHFKIGTIEYLPVIASLESVDKKHNSSLVRLILTEGQNHQVKDMMASIAHPVKRLTRVRFGNISLDQLKEGDVRPLKIHEVKQLRELSKKSKVLKKEDIRKYRKYGG